MSSVDNRVVQLTFDNDQFASKIQSSINSLRDLDSSLQLQNGTKGLDQVESVAEGLNFKTANSGLEAVISKFSVLGTIGDQVIRSLTSSALGAVESVVSKITSSVTSGGLTRALNLEQAKFQLEGLGVAWSDISEDIEYGVKDTAYGLDEAAKAASVLSASGVQTGDAMKTALRGMSGVAAMTNSSYSDISDIFATVSSNGKLMTEQLRQFSARGLNASAQLAKYLGTDEATINQMVTDGKIDFATFADAMDSAFGEHAKDANKTFSGAMANVQAALARVGADFASPALEQLRKVFVALIPVIDSFRAAIQPLATDVTNLMTKMSDATVSKLGEANFNWVPTIITAMEKAFDGLVTILSSVHRAWNDAFPAVTNGQLMQMANKIETLSENFDSFAHTISSKVFSASVKLFSDLYKIRAEAEKLGEAALPYLSSALAYVGTVAKGAYEGGLSVFKGVLSFIVPIAKDAWAIIKQVASAIASALPPATSLSDAFQNAGSAIGNFLSNTGKLVPSSSETASAIQVVTDALGKFASFMNNAFGGIVDIASSALIGVKNIFINFLKSFNFGDFLASLNLGMLAGVATSITTFVTAMQSPFASLETLAQHALRNISGTFSTLTSALKNMQTQLDLQNIRSLAVSVLMLAAAVAILSAIDVDKLAKGLGALAVVIGELVGAMALLSTFKSASFRQMTGLSIAMVSFAVAIDLLTPALAALSYIPADKMQQGLSALAGAMLIMVVALAALSKVSVTSGPTLLIAAAGIDLLTVALAALAFIPADKMSQGLESLGGALLILAVGLALMSNSLAGAAALLIAAAALAVLVPVIAALGLVPIDVICTALLSLTAILIVLGAASMALAPAIPYLLALSVAVALIGAAVALAGVGVLAFGTAMAILAGISPVAAQSIVDSLTIIITGLIRLAPQIGAAIAEAFTSFVQTIADNSETIVSAVLNLLGILLADLVAFIPQVADDVLLLIENILQVLTDHMPDIIDEGTQLIVSFLEGIAGSIPQIAQAGVDVIVAFIEAVGDSASKIVDAAIETIITFINALADSIDDHEQEFRDAVHHLFDSVAQVGQDMWDDFCGAGGNVIEGIIKGIGDGLGDLWDTVSGVASGILGHLQDGLQEHSPSKATKEMGVYLDKGIELGVKGRSSVTYKAVTAFGENVLSALSSSLRSSDSVLTPTITPVLDSSSIQNGIDSVNSLLISKLNVSDDLDMTSLVDQISDLLDPDSIGQSIADKLGEVQKTTNVNQKVTIIQDDQDVYSAAAILNRSAKAVFA